jgi:hypothetical protein
MSENITTQSNALMPPDGLVGITRKRCAELASGKVFSVAKELEHEVYPLIEALAKHVEALWEMQEPGEGLLPETAARITALVAKLFGLVPEESRDLALKSEVEAISQMLGELTIAEESEAA